MEASDTHRPTLTQEASKRDGRREGSEVDEDHSGHALTVESILEVADVLRVTSPHVSPQPAKWSTGTLQRVVGLLPRGQESLCKNKNKK